MCTNHDGKTNVSVISNKRYMFHVYSMVYIYYLISQQPRTANIAKGSIKKRQGLRLYSYFDVADDRVLVEFFFKGFRR